MHPDTYKRPLLFLLLALIVGLAFFYRPAPSAGDLYNYLSQKEVTLTGRVEHFYTAKPKSNNVILKVFTVDGIPATGYTYARLQDVEPLWKDTLEVKGRVRAPYGIDLLGNFNWRNYLAYKHVFTEIQSSEVTVIKQAPWPYRVLRAVRQDILQVFNTHLEPTLATIAGGILLGEHSDLSPELHTAFQDSGAIHLLVASGGNVGFVTLMTLAVCALFSLGRRKALIIALAVAGVYTLIAGADAPLIRAYFMAVFTCLGLLLGRNSGTFHGLVFSCFVILVFNPASLFETGFQMSFLATAALIICLHNYPVTTKSPRFVRFFVQIFLSTLAVQLALLPVFTNVFHKISLTGLIANMLLVPLASILLGLSFGYYVLVKLHIGEVLFYPLWGGLFSFRQLVEFFASFNVSALPVTSWKPGSIVAYYVVLFWVLNLPLKNWARRGVWVVAPLVTVVLLGQSLLNSGPRVYLLDEWYKGVALVETADKHLFILGNGLHPDKVKAALYHTGYKRAEAVFLFDAKSSKFDYTELAREVITPFETAWPTEKDWIFDQNRVTIVWGAHLTKDGRIWYNTGYSGSPQDDVSYCFAANGREFCVGAGARFVQQGSQITQARLNQTVQVKL